MKPLLTISLLFLLSVLLCACPFSSVYQLDESPSVNIDEALVGKWATFVENQLTHEVEPVKLILSKKNDTEYNIAFLGFSKQLRKFQTPNTDSVMATGFLSDVNGRRFINISLKAQVFIAEVRYKDDKLSVLPLSEHFTARMIRSNDILRKAVEIHYKVNTRPMIDYDFALKEMTRVN